MTYSWVCKKHDEPHFEYTLQSMLEVIKVPACSLCGEPMGRVYDAPVTHFIGSGWAGKE